MKVNGKVMGSIMKKRRIIRLCCSMMLMGVLGIGQLLGGRLEVSVNRPPVQLKRISKHVSYPGIQGAPIVQEFYLWVEVSKKMQRSMKKHTWRIEFDSFYWSGYRGLGSYGINGSEVKSMRISSRVQEWRYWKDRFELDSAKENWILIIGTVEIPTRDIYDIAAVGFGTDSMGNLTIDGTSGNGAASDPRSNDVYSDRLKRVPWTDTDPELQVFYTIEQWTRCKRRQFKDTANSYSINHFEPRKIQKVSQSVIRVDKISRTTAVFHP